jgi:hypothetical protein
LANPSAESYPVYPTFPFDDPGVSDVLLCGSDYSRKSQTIATRLLRRTKYAVDKDEAMISLSLGYLPSFSGG